jgi:endonuclease/exonuclease/phosphatase family metal-dependent hydrolase
VPRTQDDVERTRSLVRIRVVTYNIHRAIGVDRRFRPDRIIRILSAYDADVVLLQEVDDGVPRSRELDLAREIAAGTGLPHVAVGHNVRLRKGRYGNATLSRHPILLARNIELTIGRRKRRGCQHTRIDLSGGTASGPALEAFNLHLGLSAREREKQVALLGRSRELAGLPMDAPCLVGGDFNDWRGLLHPLFTEGLAFHGVSEGRGGSRRRLATFPSFFPQGALDTIYYRGRLRLQSVRRCRQLLSRWASDHLPIIADFDLSWRPAQVPGRHGGSSHGRQGGIHGRIRVEPERMES